MKGGQDVLQDAMDLAMMEFGRGVIRTVGEEIDRLEAELKLLCPGLKYVDLETDRGRVENAASSAAVCFIEGELNPNEGESWGRDSRPGSAAAPAGA